MRDSQRQPECHAETETKHSFLMTFSTRVELFKWHLLDSLRHSRALRSLNALRLYLIARCSRSIRAAELYVRSLAFSESSVLDGVLIRRVVRNGELLHDEATWAAVVSNLPRYRQLIREQTQLTRSIVLKEPGLNGEKGVLLMYFEYNWVRLALGLSGQDMKWFDENFDLILSTSWSPTDYAALALILAKTKSPVFVQACNYGEADKLRQFHPRIVVLDSLPCDWIDPQFYPSIMDSLRPIDLLMVANWGEFKRHCDFFEALRVMSPSLRVVLVGQAEGGRDADFIRSMAARIGVPQTLEIYQSIPIEEVSKLQAQAKVSIIFTRREGCCVASVESLFAGCALGMRSDAHVGPLHYINEQTGLKLRPGHLSADLEKLINVSGSLKPHEWAASNISCKQTIKKTNTLLQESALTRGLPWTEDLAEPHWRPYPTFANPADRIRIASIYEELHRRFPSVFGMNLMTDSRR